MKGYKYFKCGNTDIILDLYDWALPLRIENNPVTFVIQIGPITILF